MRMAIVIRIADSVEECPACLNDCRVKNKIGLVSSASATVEGAAPSSNALGSYLIHPRRQFRGVSQTHDVLKSTRVAFSQPSECFLQTAESMGQYLYRMGI